ACYMLVVDDRVIDPCSWSYVAPAFSLDGRHVVYVRADRGGAAVYLDDDLVARPSALPREVWVMAEGTPGYLLEESVRGRAGSRQWVVVGRHEDPRYQWVRKARLSPDGASLAYVGSAGGREIVVVRGRWSRPFGGVHEIAWTPDGRDLVVLARSAAC